MNSSMLKLLSLAYDNYIATGDTYYCYNAPDSTQWLYAIDAAQYLYEDKLIENVPYFVSSTSSHRIPALAAIDFNITEKGIEEIRRERKL